MPAPRDSDLALAARVPPHVRLGTSSWTFPGWAGLVYRRDYPTQALFTKRSLEEYARHPLLTTVGIDRSFYGPIPSHELAEYASMLPAGYETVMKVWDELTSLTFADHPRLGARRGQENPRFLDVATFAEHVALPVEESFRPHLASYVLEVPPTPGAPDVARFEARLEQFLAEAAPFGPFAVELRDVRLMTPRYFAILRAHGASHCFDFWSRMPGIAKQMERMREALGVPVLGATLPSVASAARPSGALSHTRPTVVARLLLPHGKGYAKQREAFAPFDRLVEPQPAMRADVLALARACEEAGLGLFVIVNNKAEGSAPRTVEELARLF